MNEERSFGEPFLDLLHTLACVHANKAGIDRDTALKQILIEAKKREIPSPSNLLRTQRENLLGFRDDPYSGGISWVDIDNNFEDLLPHELLLKSARSVMRNRLKDAGDVSSDAGAGHGLFETLHGYRNGAALSDAIRGAARRYYGTPAREYLTALVGLDRDKLRNRLRKLQADFGREALPANADGQVRRVCDRFALVAAGGELATEMGITGWTQGASIDAARASRRGFKPAAGLGPKRSGSPWRKSPAFSNSMARADSPPWRAKTTV